MITVLGATSTTGSAVSRALLDTGESVRVVGRDRSRLQRFVERGAVPVVADPADADALTAAMSGATAVFSMIAPGLSPEILDVTAYQRAVIAAQAHAIGVAAGAALERVVTLSGWAANFPHASGPVWGLRALEEAVDLTRVSATHLRPGWFMENALPMIGEIRDSGRAGSVIAPDRPLPMIATADIGDVAAAFLTGRRRHPERVLELQGPADLTLVDAAGIIGAALGVPAAEYVRHQPTDARTALVTSGFTAAAADGILTMSGDVSDGRIRMLTPRSDQTATPTSFNTFIAAALTSSRSGTSSTNWKSGLSSSC